MTLALFSEARKSLYLQNKILYLMSLMNQQNNKDKKKGNKNNPANKSQGSKFIAKSGKASGFSVKPHKAGGRRGS